jgi:hypothetical protein
MVRNRHFKNKVYGKSNFKFDANRCRRCRVYKSLGFRLLVAFIGFNDWQ